MPAEIDILHYLAVMKPGLKYKGMRVGFLGLPDFRYYKYQTLANNCSKLKNLGYIAERYGEYKITGKGRTYLARKENTLKVFNFKVEANTPKNSLVIYDIPELKKKEREWFRMHLKKLGFIMIQKSAWVGPSPLPKEFLEYIKTLGLRSTFKIFKLTRGYPAVR